MYPMQDGSYHIRSCPFVQNQFKCCGFTGTLIMVHVQVLFCLTEIYLCCTIYTIQTTYFQQAHSFLCVFVLKLYGYYSALRAWGHMLIYSITNSLIIKGAISAQPLAPNVLSYQRIKALRSSCYQKKDEKFVVLIKANRLDGIDFNSLHASCIVFKMCQR